jgi:hypothetical protein
MSSRLFIQLTVETELAHVAKIGKAFLLGSGLVYPIQRGILKVSPSLKLATKVSSKKKAKARKRLK